MKPMSTIKMPFNCYIDYILISEMHFSEILKEICIQLLHLRSNLIGKAQENQLVELDMCFRQGLQPLLLIMKNMLSSIPFEKPEPNKSIKSSNPENRLTSHNKFYGCGLKYSSLEAKLK